MPYIENVQKSVLLIQRQMNQYLTTKKHKMSRIKIWSIIYSVGIVLLSILYSKIFQENITHFPVYVMCGIFILGIFYLISAGVMGCLNNSTGETGSTEFFGLTCPLAAAGLCMSGIVVYMSALCIVILFTLTPITYTVYFAVLPIMYTILFAFGIGLILAVISTNFKKIGYVFEGIVCVWIFLTPVFYSINALPPELAFWIRKNPLSVFTEMMRIQILYQSVPPLVMHIKCWIVCAAVLILGGFLFRRKQRFFA